MEGKAENEQQKEKDAPKVAGFCEGGSTGSGNLFKR